MAEATGTTSDVIIPLSVDIGDADQSLDDLDAKVAALVARLATLTTASIEYYKVQEELIRTTSAATAASEKFDKALDVVSKSEAKLSENTKAISTGFESAAANTSSFSDNLSGLQINMGQSGESAKVAAQGTEWYKQTLEALRSEGGLTNVTLNELKATQKDLEKEMANAEIGSDKWRELRDDLNEVKKAQTDYKDIVRKSELEMKAQSNTIEGMRARVRLLTHEWSKTEMGSPQLKELEANLAAANKELKAHEMAIGNNSRDVGNYAGQIKEIIPEFTQLGEGMGLLGPVGQIAAKGVKGVSTAFKALLANPIVGFFAALVVGIKAFVTITDKLATKAAEDFTKKVDAETRSLDANSTALNHNVNLLRARGATAVEVANAELDAATKAAAAARDAYDSMLSEYENMGRRARKKAKETLDDLKKMADDASAKVTETSLRTEVTITAEQTKQEEERKRSAQKAVADRIAAEERAAVELKGVQASITTALADEFATRRAAEQSAYEENLAILVKNNQDTEELERLHQRTLSQIDADENAKRSADIAAAAQKRIAEQDAAYKAEQDAENIRKIEREAARATAQADLLAAETLADEEFRAAALARLEQYRIEDEEAEMLKREKEAEELQARLQVLDETLANEHLIGAERIALEQQVADAKVAISLNAATSAKAAADKELADYKAQIASRKKLDEEAAKSKQKTQATINAAIQSGINVAGEGTIAAKILNTAQAVMSTWAGAAQALNNPFPYNLAAMAATLTAGFMSIKNIWSVDVPGAASGGDISAGSSSEIAEIQTLQTSAQYQAPITETHSNMTGDEIDEINAAQRVYVVESDISSVQTRVAVVESEATF